MQVIYGDHNLDFTKLPAKSLEAMLKRGVSHFLGNEIASKITARKNKHKADNAGAEMPEADIAALHAEFVAKALTALAEGTVGTATRGPAMDPVEAKMEALAWAEILVILKNNGSKSTGKGDERVWEFANGQKFTKDELIGRRLDPTGPAGVDSKTGVIHADRLRKDAEKAIKAAAKVAEAAKANAKEAVL